MYKIAVVTGTRAEYGLLRPVLLKLAARPDVQLLLLVTGTHLAKEYGHTITEIETDKEQGILIDAELDILTQPVGEGRVATARRTALALDGCITYFQKQAPDVLVALGDRYEIFAAAQGAALLGIPVAHISGGDVTHGADDDWFRHCITKMAKLHFTSCEVYRQRVIRMGEQPDTVLNVGALGDENIRNMHLLTKAELESSLHISLAKPYALVTFHPETAADTAPARQMKEFLQAVEQLPQLTYLFTMANADAGGDEMNRMVKAYCDAHNNAVLFSSLGVLRYLSAMKYAALVLGNSSSGVVETPSFGVPCVNVGNRQTGRVTSDNIINCPLQSGAIAAAVQKAIGPGFAQQAAAVQSPYNGGDTSGQIVDALLKALQNGQLAPAKHFYDGEANTCTC